MNKKTMLGALFVACLLAVEARAQTGTLRVPDRSPAQVTLSALPWEYGVFFAGGVGVGDRADFSFANAGVRVGKVMTRPLLPGVLRGRFEYAAELMPYWQSFTPAANVHNAHVELPGGGSVFLPEPYNGGVFSGVSITPIVLRWDLTPGRRVAPFLQGAGGLIWTDHKYPPDIIVPKGQPGGTSVWNFTPQFGIGMHYFLKDRRSIDLGANAVHISSASLGDRNPGVNASVQFQIGYSWWK